VREEETQANNNCGQPCPHPVVIDSIYNIHNEGILAGVLWLGFMPEAVIHC
jgi:hypothetical protein